MGQRYDFQSPGAAAGAGLLDVLAKQRVEARQALLDEVAAKDSESRRAMDAANIAQSNDAMLTAKQNRVSARFRDAAPQLRMGQDVSTMDPELLEYMQKNAMLSPDARPPVPSVETSEELTGLKPEAFDLAFDPNDKSEHSVTIDPAEARPATPKPAKPANHGKYYRGGEDEIKQNKIVADTNAAVAYINSHPEMSHLERTTLLANARQDKSVNDVYDRPDRPQMIFSQDDGTLKEAPPINGKVPMVPSGQNNVLTHTRPPLARADTGSFIPYPPTGPDGKPLSGKVLVMKNGRVEMVDIPGMSGVGERPGTRGVGGKKGVDAVHPSIMTNLTNTLSKKNAPPEAVTQAKQAVISTWGTTDDVRDTVQELFDGAINPKTGKHEFDKRTLAELVEDMSAPDENGQFTFTKPDGTLDQEQLEQFIRLLSAIRIGG